MRSNNGAYLPQTNEKFKYFPLCKVRRCIYNTWYRTMTRYGTGICSEIHCGVRLHCAPSGGFGWNCGALERFRFSGSDPLCSLSLNLIYFGEFKVNWRYEREYHLTLSRGPKFQLQVHKVGLESVRDWHRSEKCLSLKSAREAFSSVVRSFIVFFVFLFEDTKQLPVLILVCVCVYGVKQRPGSWTVHFLATDCRRRNYGR